MVALDNRVAAAPLNVLTWPGLVLLPMQADTEKPFLFVAGTLLQAPRSEEEGLMLFQRSLTLQLTA